MLTALAVFLVAVVLLGGTLGVYFFSLLGEMRRFAGARVVTCPETRKPAGVRLHAFRAAAESLFGARKLELKSCTRWPERQDCGQECLRQIEGEPDGCLVRTLMQDFYAGKVCVVCGKKFDAPGVGVHRPALLSPERVTTPWDEIPVETLPEMLKTHRPVCWDCHVIETVMRTRPELATVRPPRPPVSL
jgi:hypothetical protein